MYNLEKIRAIKKRIFIFFTALFLLCNFLLHAQVDTRGTDFWLTFGQISNRPDTDIDVNLQIRIAGCDQAATGKIYFTNINDSVSFNINPGQVFTHNLTLSQKTAVYNTTTGTSNRSIHIVSSEPVTAFALSQATLSTDATNILPITALGTDYYQISYASVYRDAYSVVAIENATEVYHNGTLAATLNAGQVYYRISNTDIDMTGSHITTDKPVAYFMMNRGVYIPAGVWAADVQFQQYPPVNTWGKNFFVPVTHRGVERVRIVASQDGTNLTVAGGVLPTTVPVGSQNRLTNLNAGQWVELEIRIADRGCSIVADKPVGVCAYLVGVEFSGIRDIGDPATAWVPPVEQMIASATIAPFVPTGETALNSHYALVIVPTNAKAQTTMTTGTGTPVALSGGTWYDNTAVGYSYYIRKLSNSATTAYTFANPQKLFVLGYGLGNHESYYYVAGCAFRSLDVAFYANDIHYQDLSAEVICSQPTQFRAEITGDISSSSGYLKWYINNIEELAARDQWTWSKTFADGTYNIKMEVLYNDNNLTTKTVEAEMVVATTLSIITHPSISPAEQCTNTGDFSTALSIAATGTGLTYQWYRNTTASNTGGTLITGATSATYIPTSNLPAGNYYYYCVITTTSVCSSTETSNVSGVHVIYELPSIPIVTPLSDIVFCDGDSVVLRAISARAIKYQWYTNGVAILQDTLPTLTVKQSGSYTVDVWGAGDCPALATSNTVEVVVHKVPTNPDLTARSVTEFCKGLSVILDVYADDVVSYEWYRNGTRISGVSGSSYTVVESGSYTVKALGSGGCYAEQTSNEIVVTVYELPTNPIISPSDTINLCDGQSVLLTVTSVGAEYFQWFKNGVAIPLGVSSTYLVYDPGKYTVEVISIEQCVPEEKSNAVQVIVIPLPGDPVLIPQSATDFCEDLSVDLVAQARDAIGYEWYKDNVLIAGVTGDTYTASETGNYYVEANGGGDCYALSSSNEVSVVVRKNPLIPTIYPSPAPPYYYGVDYRLNLSPTENGVRYKWYKDGVFIGELGISHFIPILKDSDSGLYYVEAINEYCMVLSPDFILAPIVLPELFIPNVFTPNGDGINDNFYILGLAAFPENELTVINKRGKLVYSKKYYDNSWDGEGQPDDIYYYYFKVISPEGEKTVHRGYVYIKRKK